MTAEKYYDVDETDDVCGFFNIAAFKIDQSTRTGIENVISALSVTWQYIPSDEMMGNYYAIYKKYYTEKQVCLLQKIEQRYRYIESFAQMREKPLKELEDYENIYIYGAGYNGRRLKNI